MMLLPSPLTKSTSGEANNRQREGEIKANPLHPEHVVDDWSIRSRVQASFREIAQIEDKVHRHLHRYANSQTTNQQENVRLSVELYQEVMAQALNRVNDYYNKETKASIEEFHQAINTALQERGMEPVVFRHEAPTPQQSLPKVTAADKQVIAAWADKA